MVEELGSGARQITEGGRLVWHGRGARVESTSDYRGWEISMAGRMVEELCYQREYPYLWTLFSCSMSQISLNRDEPGVALKSPSMHTWSSSYDSSIELSIPTHDIFLLLRMTGYWETDIKINNINKPYIYIISSYLFTWMLQPKIKSAYIKC